MTFDVEFVLRALGIVAIDLAVAGDNALVIALAVRTLPARQQRSARVWGTAAAVALRLAGIFVVTHLLKIPLLRLAGGIVLVWIAARLVRQPSVGGGEHRAAVSWWDALWIIVVADAAMSLDNVLAVAAAARGDFLLALFGVALSIPIVVWGSGLVAALMNRYAWVIGIGGAILGYVAGEMVLDDNVVERWLRPDGALRIGLPIALAAGVAALGWTANRPRTTVDAPRAQRLTAEVRRIVSYAIDVPQVRRAVGPFTAFFNAETAGGIVLMACAAVAVIWANVAGDSYGAVWQQVLTIGAAPFGLSKPVVLWINDGLMAVFFLLVGLEIKRELLAGELASRRRATLPVVAAVGGMVAPAAIYAALNLWGPGARGWGIPVATDIAFALGALALLGGRVVASLRVFLAAVAIVDDLGAVLVIALAYAADLVWPALAAAAVVLAGLAALNRARTQHPAPYAVLGLMLWGAVLQSGVHATVAGVLLAMMIPAGRAEPASGAAVGRDARPLLHRIEQALQPWVSFAIMPLFALANAGVRLSGDAGASLLDPVTLGVILGLVAGKQIGVMASCWAVVRLGVAELPSRATWRQLYGVAVLCGIGFTMSLFIATLAFEDPASLAHAKIGVLTGSLVSGVAGCLVLARAGVSAGRRSTAEPAQAIRRQGSL